MNDSNNDRLVVIKSSSAPRASATAGKKTPIVNPYKKQSNGSAKFIGGAEAARLKAQRAATKAKRPPTKIITPGERERLEESVLPPKMKVFERFFAALFRSSVSDFVTSETGPSVADALWLSICKRVGLTVPSAPIKPYYDDARAHFSIRAALVLEEARKAIAQPLAAKWQAKAKGSRRPNSNSSMILTAHYFEAANTHGHAKIEFRKEQCQFTKDELFHIRPGGVFECIPRDSAQKLSDVLLGVVVTSSREQVEKKCTFCLMFFRDLPSKVQDSEWIITPVEALVTQLRCFEAMTNTPDRVGFLHSLLGLKTSVHTKFESADENSYSPPTAMGKVNNANGGNRTIDEYFGPQQVDAGPAFTLPRLNSTQEKAATAFLESEQNTITLIQGPPGTGKTTLLVSVICRYLQECGLDGGSRDNVTKQRRLLVCAPTNKAISVLAARFLAAANRDKCIFNAIMAGDADKLLVEERSSNGRQSSWNNDEVNISKNLELRSIFIYSWMNAVIEDYVKIRNFFSPGKFQGRGHSKTDLYNLAVRLERRLRNSLPGLPTEVFVKAESLSLALKNVATSNEIGAGAGIVSKVSALLKELEEVSKQADVMWRQLLGSADIIFCTLASAGGAIFRNTVRINDMICDEAAAATEPELSIPFYLRPSRLLCVGDPLQLPATVISRKAIQFGLDKSLHERLMYECGYSHVMLDVQYRMHPEISSFPSCRFYQSKLMDGDNVKGPRYQSGAKLLLGRPYSFVQVDGVEEQDFCGSYRNPMEARYVVDLIVQLRQLSQNLPGASGSASWHSTDRVRIITFYQAQVTLLKRMLKEKGMGDKVVVATVDSSQGCEADIVIVSFVRSRASQIINAEQKEKNEPRHGAGFLTDNRRMNVALTRARFQLICVGNAQFMEGLTGNETMTLQLLAKNAKERGAIQRHPYPSGNLKWVRKESNNVTNRVTPVEPAVSVKTEPVEPAVSVKNAPVQPAVSVKNAPVQPAVSVKSEPVEPAVSVMNQRVELPVSVKNEHSPSNLDLFYGDDSSTNEDYMQRPTKKLKVEDGLVYDDKANSENVDFGSSNGTTVFPTFSKLESLNQGMLEKRKEVQRTCDPCEPVILKVARPEHSVTPDDTISETPTENACPINEVAVVSASCQPVALSVDGSENVAADAKNEGLSEQGAVCESEKLELSHDMEDDDDDDHASLDADPYNFGLQCVMDDDRLEV